MIMRRIFLSFALVAATYAAWAEIPAGYYDACEGKTGQALLTALYNTITNHTTVSYDGLWTLYKTSDVYDNGKIWDMYSTKQWTYSSDQCGSYKNVGDCYNREHSMPKSWFNDASPMYSDAFHIYPTDGKVNGQRSNYPYGECANGTTLASSGGVQALGKLGTCTFSGYTGVVFEPVDEYKGDFARSYFYMATCYNNRISSWSSDMLAGNSYPAFTTWAVNLLLKWHRQDPVSEKELNRNEAVYAAQHNRNPYIDHPELAEYVWGDNVGTSWSASLQADPEIVLPVSGTTIDMGTSVVNVARTAKVNVKGVNLSADVLISVTGADFSVSSNSVTAAAANATDGTMITITYLPTAVGTGSGTLTLTSNDLTSTVILSGKAIDTLPAGPVTAISDDAFTATWSFVGDANANGEYSLYVYENGTLISEEYPTFVTASDEAYTVTNLSAATTYTYIVKSENLTSEEVAVTTLEPIPVVSASGTGSLTANVSEASEYVRLDLWIENINEDISVSVDGPFQISTDLSTWSTTLTISQNETQLYVRLYSDTAGSYTSSIKFSTASGYYSDDFTLEGIVTEPRGFWEDFEAAWDSSNTYTTANVVWQGTQAVWKTYNGGIWNKEGVSGQGFRFGPKKNGTAYLEMNEDYSAGFGIVSLWAKEWSANEGATTIEVQYSTDQGTTWTTAGTANVTSTTYSEFTFAINQSGNVRMKILKTDGDRMLLDDVQVTTYATGGVDYLSNEGKWEAFCRGGKLVISAAEAVEARVYGIDGVEYYNGKVISELSLSVGKGIYIVIVGEDARQVLVK